MLLRRPSYYSRFHCVAGSCPDSCCHLWQVELSPETVEKYLSLPGALGEQLRAAIRREEDRYYFVNTHDRCPMWRDDGLCRLQAELGEEYLSPVCRSFPRIQQDYGTFTEELLELSCPEAARLLLTNPQFTMEETTVPGGDAPDYDGEVMEILLASRPVALALLDSDLPIAHRLAALLLYSYQVQSAVDGGELTEFDAEGAIAAITPFLQPGSPADIAEFYASLEGLTAQWPQLLSQAAAPRWEESSLALARYGIWRYWLQAVSDFDLAGRMKMVVLSCILCASLPGDRCRVLQLYAKEIENDADNLDAILDNAYSHPALTDGKLLHLLLKGEEYDPV